MNHFQRTVISSNFMSEHSSSLILLIATSDVAFGPKTTSYFQMIPKVPTPKGDVGLYPEGVIGHVELKRVFFINFALNKIK